MSHVLVVYHLPVNLAGQAVVTQRDLKVCYLYLSILNSDSCRLTIPLCSWEQESENGWQFVMVETDKESLGQYLDSVSCCSRFHTEYISVMVYQVEVAGQFGF